MIAKLRLNATKCDKLHDVYMMLVTTSIYLPCSKITCLQLMTCLPCNNRTIC